MSTREEFFARPNYWYYVGGQPIPDEGIAAAREELPEFRDNLTYEFVREAGKIGDIGGLTHRLRFLESILPLHRMVEVYERVRAQSPDREPEFRPTFERVFGERMSAFPAPLPTREYEEPAYPYGVPDAGMDDDAIPFRAAKARRTSRCSGRAAQSGRPPLSGVVRRSHQQYHEFRR